MEIKGKFNTATVLLPDSALDTATRTQIQELTDTERFKDNKIVMMSDTHAGAPAPIGLTMKINNPLDKFPYELVGNDIGCGVTMTVFYYKNEISKDKLETIYKMIEKSVPIYGRDELPKNNYVSELLKKSQKLHCGAVPLRTLKTFGTLGNGNHFIEIGQTDYDPTFYTISVHSGSRGVGSFVFSKYKEIAENGSKTRNQVEREKIINEYKAKGRDTDIEEALKALRTIESDGYLNDIDVKNYLDDMNYAIDFAEYSRFHMVDRVLSIIENVLDYNIHIIDHIVTTHNYYDTEDNILRKGAVRSQGVIVTPLNMNQGILISQGKYLEENNFSAPHGAGRIMSRKQANQEITIESLRNDMTGIVTDVRKGILDESPRAYKDYDSLKDYFDLTMDVQVISKPILNFKGGDKD